MYIGTIINYIADYLIKNKETVFLHAYYLKEDILVNSLKKIPIYIVRGKCDDIGIRGCIVYIDFFKFFLFYMIIFRKKFKK